MTAGEGAQVSLAALANDLWTSHGGSEGDAVWCLQQALFALDKAVAWAPAVASAEVDANRFREAARHLAGKALPTAQQCGCHQFLIEALAKLSTMSEHDTIGQVAALLLRTPVSARVTNLLLPRPTYERPAEPAEQPASPVVLLRFNLDDQPVSWPIALTPGRAYRLQATARTDSWPSSATHLSIRLESPVPPSVIERPTITIERGTESAQGYLVPRAEINPHDSVVLTPSAAFENAAGSEWVASVIGQRSLRVTTFDPTAIGSDQPMVAQRILDLLAELDARIPSLPSQDRRDLIHLLQSTARFAALANERDDLRGIDEPGFQTKLKEWFVADRYIGLRIREASQLGSGTTDLMLQRIVDELKVSRNQVTIDSPGHFARQSTQYASAGDCPISVLTILDDSPKFEPPGIQSNYMRWLYPAVHGGGHVVSSMVALVIIPIGISGTELLESKNVMESPRQTLIPKPAGGHG
jgi:hypothetical protein